MQLILEDPSSDLLYIRDFYPSLLEDIRKRPKAILIGNPGISKSMFQYYYLLRIINPLFGVLPPDHLSFRSDSPTIVPDIVVRQIREEGIEVFDISNETVYEVPDTKLIFRSLLTRNQKLKSLYLMEPGASNNEPYRLNIPTLITVSPNTSRYKEFLKHRAIPFYMPSYSEQELLTIGRYLRGTGRVPEDMEEEYKEESLKKRFKQYGGIIRHVLPTSIDNMLVTLNAQRSVLLDVKDMNQAVHILSAETIEDKRVSHFIAQYEVPCTTEDNTIKFRQAHLEIVSEDVRNKLLAVIGKFSLQDMISTLVSNDRTNAFKGLTYKLFEKVFVEMSVSENGLTCQQQKLDLRFQSGVMKTAYSKPNPLKWTPYTLKFPPGRVVEGSSPAYANLESKTLYYPTSENHPFCEFFYKESDGTLVMFQLTRQVSGPKYIKQSAFLSFLKKINFPKDKISTKLKLIFVPGPFETETAFMAIKRTNKKEAKDEKTKLKQEKDEEKSRGKLLVLWNWVRLTFGNLLVLMKTYTILKLDEHYSRKST